VALSNRVESLFGDSIDDFPRRTGSELTVSVKTALIERPSNGRFQRWLYQALEKPGGRAKCFVKPSPTQTSVHVSTSAESN
jgi:hypothetical protein